MTVTRLDRSALLYEGKEGKRLGFPTGLSPRRFIGTDMIAMKKAGGLFTDSSGRVFPWPVENLVEIEGEMVVLGPWIEGTTAFDPRDTSPLLLLRLLPALHALQESKDELGGLFLRALRLIPGGGVLIFPPVFAAFSRNGQGNEESHEDHELWTHPDLKGDEGWSFSLAVLIWRALTGADPFGDETGEHRRERIRRGKLPDPALLVPGLNEEAAKLLSRALAPAGHRLPGLDEWERLIHRWAHGELIENLATDRVAELQKRSIREIGRTNLQMNLRRWIRRYGWMAITAAAILTVTVILITPAIRNTVSPPTAGMSPIEVVKTYYDSMDALDSQTMNACVSGKAGKKDLRQITTLYVTQRMRQVYEGIPQSPDAKEWVASGMPPLSTEIPLWGVTHLKITELERGRVRAEYVLWYPDSQKFGPHGNARTDLLSLVEGRRAWKITEIVRREEAVRKTEN